MGFQKDMSDLAQSEDLGALDAMLGLAKIVFQRAAEDPASITEEGIAACMSSLAKVATATTDEATWDELREFIDIAEPEAPKVDAKKGSPARHRQKTL